MAWLSGFLYRKSHVINPSSGAGSGYQIRFKVYYGEGEDSGEEVYLNGHCRDDFGDVRFTSDDGVTLLSYWIEELVTGSYAIFWVKIDKSLDSEPVTIYIYYGNENETSQSNGENTFIFFDCFDEAALDENKWTLNAVGSITYSLSNGALVIQDAMKSNGTYWINSDTKTGSQHQLKCDVIDNISVEWKSYFPEMSAAGYIGQIGFALVDINDYVKVYLNHYDGDIGTIQYRRGWRAEASGDFEAAQANDLVKFKFTRVGSTVNFYVDDTLKYTGSLTTDPNKIALAVGAYGPYSLPQISIYYVYIRKYVDPEPLHAEWGEEEAYTPPYITAVNQILSMVYIIVLIVVFNSLKMVLHTVKGAVKK